MLSKGIYKRLENEKKKTSLNIFKIRIFVSPVFLLGLNPKIISGVRTEIGICLGHIIYDQHNIYLLQNVHLSNDILHSYQKLCFDMI